MGYGNVEQCSTDIETAYGIDQAETWRDQRLVLGSFKPRLERKTHQDRTVVARLNDRRPPRAGSKYGAGFDASFFLDGLSASLVTAQAYSHPQTSLAEILRQTLGGQRGDSGSTTVAGASTTVIDVQVGHGVRFVGGGALVTYCTVNGVSRPYMREIASVAGDNVTLKMALPAVPGAGAQVLNCATFYIDPAGVGGAGNSMAFRFLGYDSEDKYSFRGVVGTFTIETSVDEQLVLVYSGRAATWKRDATLGTLGAGTHVGGGPLDWRWGEVQLGTPGATTLKIFKFSDVSLNPGLSLLEDRGPDGVETMRRFYMGAAHPTLDLTCHQLSESDWDAYVDEYDIQTGSGTRQSHWALLTAGEPVVGGNGTGMVGLSLPRLEYAKAPERIAGDEGYVDMRFSFDGDEDENAGANTSEIEKSIFRVHLA